MNSLIIYKSATESLVIANAYMQIVNVRTGSVFNNTTSKLAKGATYAHTAAALTLNTDYNGWPIVIPAALPAGEYDLVIKDNASPANTDGTKIGRRFEWDGDNISNLRDI